MAGRGIVLYSASNILVYIYFCVPIITVIIISTLIQYTGFNQKNKYLYIPVYLE